MLLYNGTMHNIICDIFAMFAGDDDNSIAIVAVH